MKSLSEKISIMQAYERGEDIEFSNSKDLVRYWCPTQNPVWNWDDFDYRVRTKTPDYINWSHVGPSFKYMTRDDNGEVNMWLDKPTIAVNNRWNVRGGFPCPVIGIFSSYKMGNVDWRDSLVCRPE